MFPPAASPLNFAPKTRTSVVLIRSPVFMIRVLNFDIGTCFLQLLRMHLGNSLQLCPRSHRGTMVPACSMTNAACAAETTEPAMDVPIHWHAIVIRKPPLTDGSWIIEGLSFAVKHPMRWALGLNGIAVERFENERQEPSGCGRIQASPTL